MKLRVGLDLVLVETVQEALRTQGDRYLERIYTPQEIEDCHDGDTVSPHRLAARFAAKEAALKALRLPPNEGLDWRSIELVREPDGWTWLRLTGRARELADGAGLSALSVSVTHEALFAAAIVAATSADDD
ncbi:MAG TPA: holo-ACP synthase [Gaiellaceae bacterium]|jgi:holo-[acyl-carrier protein] synthase